MIFGYQTSKVAAMCLFTGELFIDKVCEETTLLRAQSVLVTCSIKSKTYLQSADGNSNLMAINGLISCEMSTGRATDDTDMLLVEL